MNPEEKSRIERLNKTLYSRNAPDIRSNRRMHLEEQDNTVNTDWQHDPEVTEAPINQNYKDKTMSFLTKILITSFVFFLVAMGIGAYLVFNGSNIVSANNVDISINGPVSLTGGENANFDVQILNHNNIKLEDVTFSVDFPSGTVDPQDSSRELKNIREKINNIEAGGLGQKSIQAIFYGEENSKKQVIVSVEYHVKGSNAPFTKEKTIDLLISSSPLNITVNSFKEITSGQEFEMAVNIQSNSKDVIKNLLLKASYPFGFNFISSDLSPITSDNATWKIGDIPPGGKKTIKIKGSLDAQNDESRNFRFSAGAPRVSTDKVIGTEYTSNTQEISIKKPFMTVGISMGGDASGQEFHTNFNNAIGVDVNYFNNLPVSIDNAEVRVKISGTAFDKFSVSPVDGLYSSANGEIVWNAKTTSGLRSIESGGEGKVGFTITPKDLSVGQKKITNPDIKVLVSIQGKRNSETNVPESISSTASRVAKVSSNITLSGQVLRLTGPFANTGFVPPKVEQATTYTVVWTVDNTANNTSNVQVQSSLPPYVKWLGKFSPNAEDISYDNVTGQIIWNVGTVGTYTVGTPKRRQVTFQVSMTPSITQIDQVPVIVNQSSISASDDFTGETLKGNLGSMNTRFATEPGFKDGDDRVVK